MRDINFQIKLFEARDEKSFRRSAKDIVCLMEALVWVDRLWLRQYPDTPDLYESGVRYEPEFGTENWQDIGITLEKGFGDCEDLACWRIAELREKFKVNAKPWVRWKRRANGTFLFHALVRLPDRVTQVKVDPDDRFSGNPGAYRTIVLPGEVEDPSARLGMYHWKDYGCSEECELAIQRDAVPNAAARRAARSSGYRR